MIRDATGHDRAALNALTQASSAYVGAYRAILNGYEITAAQLARDVFRIAERDGAIAGYYSLTFEPAPELDLMFVADSAKGAGIGAILFNDMLAVARVRGVREVKIVSHPPSVGFYERMGARRIGEAPATARVSWTRPILVVTP